MLRWEEVVALMIIVFIYSFITFYSIFYSFSLMRIGNPMFTFQMVFLPIILVAGLCILLIIAGRLILEHAK